MTESEPVRLLVLDAAESLEDLNEAQVEISNVPTWLVGTLENLEAHSRTTMSRGGGADSGGSKSVYIGGLPHGAENRPGPAITPGRPWFELCY